MNKKYFILASIVGLFPLISVFAMDTDQSHNPIVTKKTAPISPEREAQLETEFEANREKMEKAIKRVDKMLGINQPRPKQIKK